MTTTGVLDETYDRLADAGPEFGGWLSNHGPMAADAMVRLGRPAEVSTWLDGYVKRLEEAPASRQPIDSDGWREPLGDPSRLGDWSAFFARELRSNPWEHVLARWWPRLLPGAVASAAHGLIRTGHAVRALREQVTSARVDELGRALGYWAARWQLTPGLVVPVYATDAGSALDAVPARDLTGGIRNRLAGLEDDPEWASQLAGARPAPAPATIPPALDTLVDTAVTGYGRWAHGNPTMLVHAATAPRAVALVLPSLPEPLWAPSHDVAWALAATLVSIYKPVDGAEAPADSTPAPVWEDVIDRAVAGGDEHAIKFTEVARESHARGNQAALGAAARAVELLEP
ncbi:MAG TPA: hypothetical protein VKV06_13020 [Acidimicrobiales bacterium]|nr:hypothetical protein [Acidimicrobiales bacterium]